MASGDPWSRLANALRRGEDEQVRVPEAPNVWAVILAGSVDARTWPEWHEGAPAFLATKEDATSALGNTLDLLSGIVPSDQIAVACTPAHVVMIARACVRVPEQNFLVEPLPRGSGPVLALALARISKLDPTAIIMSMPAEHALRNQESISQAFELGVEAARLGWVASTALVFGNREPTYGFIEGSAVIAVTYANQSAYRVKRFLSPEQFAGLAQRDPASPVFQNSGIYFSRADVLMEALSRFRPDLWTLAARLSRDWEPREWSRYDFERVSYNAWLPLATISIERDVLQRTEPAAFILVSQ